MTQSAAFFLRDADFASAERLLRLVNQAAALAVLSVPTISIFLIAELSHVAAAIPR
jgi:hypothetical protein